MSLPDLPSGAMHAMPKDRVNIGPTGRPMDFVNDPFTKVSQPGAQRLLI